MDHLEINRNFTIGYKNIQGLHGKNGCKIEEYYTELYSDIEILSETWGCNCEKVFEGYEILAQVVPQKRVETKKGRKSGGLLIIGKKYLKKFVHTIKINNSYIWIEICKNLIKNLEKNLLLLCAYISDVNSKYFNPNTYDDIAEDISNFCEDNTPLILIGDMNSRTGNMSEDYIEPDLGLNCCIETRSSSIDLPICKNCDGNINNQGKSLIDVCHKGDPLGNFTFFDPNIGASAIDYSICNQSFYKNIKNFMFFPISDHCKIVTELEEILVPDEDIEDHYKWTPFNRKFQWDNKLAKQFTKQLSDDKKHTKEIKQRIEAGLINSSGELIQELFQKTATNFFKCKQDKVHYSNPIQRQKLSRSKKWFDKDCMHLKKDVRKLGRQKSQEPTNLVLREKYCIKLKQFKNNCKNKRYHLRTPSHSGKYGNNPLTNTQLNLKSIYQEKIGIIISTIYTQKKILIFYLQHL